LIVDYGRDKANGRHISSMYAEWFYRLFGVSVDTEPFVAIPKEWLTYSALKLLSWGITPSQREQRFIVFLNYTAKSSNRCWPLPYVIDLINQLRPALTGGKKPFFVINTLPFDIQNAQRLLSTEKGSDVILFSAQENFFQLPAIMKQADLVVSVDTAIIHLAAALKKPVVALMRRKNTEWHPYHKAQRLVINPVGRLSVKQIPVALVLEQIKKFVADLPLEEKVNVIVSAPHEASASQ
jgi:ADP-heptose:LPS heptosyltransferase